MQEHLVIIIFQFQYGAIKSLVWNLLINNSVNFNSNMVRLKGLAKFQKALQILNFNSNMVRLKGSRWPESPFTIRNFNSNMVRLKANDEIRHVCRSLISIPIWCD